MIIMMFTKAYSFHERYASMIHVLQWTHSFRVLGCSLSGPADLSSIRLPSFMKTALDQGRQFHFQLVGQIKVSDWNRGFEFWAKKDWLQVPRSRDPPTPPWLFPAATRRLPLAPKACSAAKRGQTAPEAAKRANSAFTIVCGLILVRV